MRKLFCGSGSSELVQSIAVNYCGALGSPDIGLLISRVNTSEDEIFRRETVPPALMFKMRRKKSCIASDETYCKFKSVLYSMCLCDEYFFLLFISSLLG